MMKCPHCANDVSLHTSVSDDSSMVLTLEPGPDSYLQAETIGGAITNIAEVMQATAKEQGVSVATFVNDLLIYEDGKVRIGFSIARSATTGQTEDQ